MISSIDANGHRAAFGSVSRLVVTPSTVTVAPGATAKLTVTVIDDAGNTVVGAPITVTTDSTQVATARVTTSRIRTLSESYVVTGVAPGIAHVTIACLGVTANVVVTVAAPSTTVTQVTLTPSTADLTPGATVRLTARALDRNGFAVTTAPIVLTSRAPQVATVDQTGLVTAIAAGVADIEASSQGLVVSTRITVSARAVTQVSLTPASVSLAAGNTTTLAARAVDNIGIDVLGASIVFSSDAPQVATVNQSGVVTGIATGSAQISATSQGVSAVSQVTVTPRPVSQLTISPSNFSLVTGAQAGLTARALDDIGAVIPGITFTWASSAPQVATVQQTGLVTAIAPGTTQISISALGFTTVAQLTVTGTPVSQVTLTPASLALLTGATGTLTASALDNAGQPVSGAVVLFTSSAPAIATVNATGVVTGVAPGTAQITASSQGISKSSAVTVSARPVAQVTLTPPTSSIVAGAFTTLTARALDALGTDVAGATISFSSSATSVATVNSQGVVTAVAPGTAQITASSGGFSANAQITVTPRPVSQVTLTPPTASVVVGGTATFSAQAIDNIGAPVAGAVIAFSSSATSVATVDQSGIVTAVAPGTAQITASSNGISATALVTVLSKPVASVTISPTTASLVAGGSTTLTAQALDNTGTAVAGAVITFSSNAPAIATVTAGGLVTAIAAGTAQISASSGGFSASAQLTVTPRPVAQVTLSPVSVSVTTGNTVQLSAEARDNTGAIVPGAVITFSSDATSVATVSASGLVTAIAAGTTIVRASSGGFQGASTIVVTAPQSGVAIDVAPSITYQTMNGWEATAQIGESECNATAYGLYKNSVLDRSVNELGINRIRLELRSGIEHTTDYFLQWRNGQISTSTFNANRYVPVNDDGNASSFNASGFKWTEIDTKVDEIVNPLRARLAARGEQLYVNLNYIDFKATRTAFNHMESPAEYAELIAATFQHLQSKYGWVPNSVEMLLEPENTPWSAAQIAAAAVAASNRLATFGWHPDFIAPSTTNMSNGPTYWDAMRSVSGASSVLTDLAYHRYGGVSTANLQAIGARRTRDNVRTAMLEHIGSGIDDLIEDLTVGGVSSWQQFALAFCGTDGSANYYVINQSAPSNPIVSLSATGTLLRQVFQYVRAGAVRVDATSANSGVAVPVAFRNTSGAYVVAIRAKSAQPLLLRGLPAGTYGVSYSVGGAVVNLSDVAIGAGGSASVSIPAAGVITVYGR